MTPKSTGLTSKIIVLKDSIHPYNSLFEKLTYITRKSKATVHDENKQTAGGGTVDTLYASATGGKSVSFPRVSPDGKYLVYTLSSYGNFSIWHKDADLYLLDLQTGESRPLSALNSNDVESYHSWSSNSRWMVFSSRRLDGLHTRPYLVHLDEQGRPSKPFLLPQAHPDFYDDFRFSYNIPELVDGKVELDRRQVLEASED